MTTAIPLALLAQRSATPMIAFDASRPVLDIVIPVYNEEVDLVPCVRRLHTYLSTHIPYSFLITVADNASTDATLAVAYALTHEFDAVRVIHVDAKGRGRALKHVWSNSGAAVLAYMDVDLSTDLNALLPLVAPLLSGHSDLAIGSRLTRGSRVVRGAKREIISRCYNLILRCTLAAGFSDAQCGFKAIRADVARRLLPLVDDTGWFFDTELLILAERAGLRIHEVPVDWIDDPHSRVDLVATAFADLQGIARVGKALVTGQLPLARVSAELGRIRTVPSGHSSLTLIRQLMRFATIGIASTLAYAGLYLLLDGVTGAQLANLLALVLTAVANTAANRRHTFGVRGSGHARHQVQSLLLFSFAVALTSGSLALLHALTTTPTRTVEFAVLAVSNLVATILRFTFLRLWVFSDRHGARRPW